MRFRNLVMLRVHDAFASKEPKNIAMKLLLASVKINPNFRQLRNCYRTQSVGVGVNRPRVRSRGIKHPKDAREDETSVRRRAVGNKINLACAGAPDA